MIKRDRDAGRHPGLFYSHGQLKEICQQRLTGTRRAGSGERHSAIRLAECKIVSFCHNADHGLSGIQKDFISVIIKVFGGGVVAVFLPGDMNSFPVSEEPSVPGGVVTLCSTRSVRCGGRPQQQDQ